MRGTTSPRRGIAQVTLRAAALLVVCGSEIAAQPAPIHRGHGASPAVATRLYVPSGRVRIAVWQRDSIDITGTIGASSSFFGGGSRDAAKFGVEPLRTGDRQLAEADWLVTVPRRARLWIKMTTGTIETDGTEGELELYTIGGSITVRGARGVTSVESIDAPVRIIASSGSIRVRGGKGSLLLQDASGIASVTSVSGTVDVTGSVAPDATVETIGGDIRIAVPRLRGVGLELQTHSGAITATIDRKQVPLLDLSSRSGQVTTPVPVGAATHGRITARSFRGAVSLRFTP